MSIDLIAAYRKKIAMIGAYNGVRMLKNKGLSFADAYFVMFGIAPRLIGGAA